MQQDKLKVEYEFMFTENGKIKTGTYFEASTSNSTHIAAVKCYVKRGKVVSRDMFVKREHWVENTGDGPEDAINARNKK